MSNFALGLEVGMTKTIAMFAILEIMTCDWDAADLGDGVIGCHQVPVLRSFKYVKVTFEPAATIESLVLRGIGDHVIIA